MVKDMKKCIKDFIHHVNTLEGEEDPEGNGFNREYRLIHEAQVKNRRDNAFSMESGRKDNNSRKNRYKDILPYDEHRVSLKEVEGEEDSDYINASKLMGVRGTGGYIASQGPLAATVNDFWRMVWEFNVEIIFMACRIVELGKIKCKQYWNDEGQSDEFGAYTVLTEKEETISSDFIRRQFKLSHGGEERLITQYHYSGWPDHGIPRDAAHIRDLIGMMRQARQKDEHPLLVHCSAGCGRTGAIVAIDYVWTMLEEGKFDETFNLFELICNFRMQRMSMVQTAEQYALVNQVLRSLCEDWVTKMASHTYENVEIGDNVEYEDVDDEPKKLKDEEEEHVYDDNISLKQEMTEIEKETKFIPEKISPKEEKLVMSEVPKNKQGPELNEVVPPIPERNKGESAYEELEVVPPDKEKRDKSSNEQTKDGTRAHSTVIQIGSAVAPKDNSSATGGVAGSTVFYLYGTERRSTPPQSPQVQKIRDQPPLSKSISEPAPSGSGTASSTSGSGLPKHASLKMADSSDVYAQVIPKSDRVGGSITGPPQAPQRTASTTLSDPAPSNSSTSGSASPKIGSLNMSDVYSEVIPKHQRVGSSSSVPNPAPQRTGSTNSNRSVFYDYDNYSEVAPPIPPVQPQSHGPIPGFDDRLPRVRGPVPPPQSWDNS